MTRPGERALTKLPTLESRRAELETCAFCPKLCRTKCPVSNAEPREALIPWGKMTATYQAALGDEPMTADAAALAWACTGCLACREACDHGNPVAQTLGDARAAYAAAGLAPESLAGLTRALASDDASEPRVRGDGHGPLLLVGCGYAKKLPDVAAQGEAVARAVLGDRGGSLRVIDGCCGLSFALAGDREGAVRARAALARARGSAPLVVMDPGCALALREAGVEHELLIDLAARTLPTFAYGGAQDARGAVYHDPCALGRGLGRYDEPRRLLAHVLGEPAEEFAEARERAVCSGAGGLLPRTMPEVSARIGAARAAAAGDRPIVTACASSLRRFRRDEKNAFDLFELLARALTRRDSEAT